MLKKTTKKTAPKRRKKEPEIKFTPLPSAAPAGEPTDIGEQIAMPGFNPLYIERYMSIVRDNYYTMNKTLWITTEIDPMLCQEAIKFLNFWDDGTKEPVTIYISSPGGNVDFGFALIDAIMNLQDHGTQVNTICVGQCASMASLILAAGSKGCRHAYPSSRIMIHQPYYIFCPDGTIEGMNTNKGELECALRKGVDLLVKKTKKSRKQVEALFNSGDNYMSANEAKKLGLIDTIGCFTN